MKEYSVQYFDSKELNRTVRVFIMLPQSYHNTIKKYPVLYMHDGHNLFDDKQATFGKSWGILDAYEEHPYLPEVIIVGIETIAPNRNFELVPIPFQFDQSDDQTIYGGKTDLYFEFVTQTLKPYIDQRYRTFKSPKNTAIMGSSFGGVASLYAAIKYNDYFGMFGCVSNAFYVIQEEMEKLVKDADLSHIQKLYMDVGTKETSTSIYNKEYVISNQKMYDILSSKLNKDKLRFEIIEDGKHNERDWERRFPTIIQYLFNK